MMKVLKAIFILIWTVLKEMLIFLGSLLIPIAIVSRIIEMGIFSHHFELVLYVLVIAFFLYVAYLRKWYRLLWWWSD